MDVGDLEFSIDARTILPSCLESQYPVPSHVSETADIFESSKSVVDMESKDSPHFLTYITGVRAGEKMRSSPSKPSRINSPNHLRFE